MNDNFKKSIQKTFDKASETYGETPPFFFDYFGKKLIQHAELRPQSRVLDITCGKGAVSLNIASLYPQADITAIDLSHKMIEAVSAKAHSLGYNNIKALQMDAEELDFPGQQFDFVFSGFGLFFLPEIEKTLKSVYQLLKPSGILAFSSFRGLEEFEITRPVMQKYFPEEDMDHYSANKYNFRHFEEMEQLLADAGLWKWKIFNEQKDFTYESLQQWWDKQWSHGRAGKLMALEADGMLEQFQSDCYKVLTPYLKEGRLTINEDVFYVYGIKS